MKTRGICRILVIAVLLSMLSFVPKQIRATEASTTPGETVPEETTPETTVPDEEVPDETTPEEQPPEEEGPMTVSDAFIEMLKTMEGFHPVAYWDYSQWTIGYGTKCPEGKEKYYTIENPMTEEEAVALLHEELLYFETVVNTYAQKHGLELLQHQFDALVSFSYNCGGNWVNDLDGYFNTAIREGDMSNRLIYGMLLWSKAGGDFILVNRRKCEANMYINGIYKAYNTPNSIPDFIKHVFLDGNGGTTRYIIHGYNADDPAGIITDFKTMPTGLNDKGETFTYTFAGWFTEPTGGTEITVLDGSLPNGTVLYARWKDPQGNFAELPKGEPADDIAVTVTGTVNVRTGPGTYYPVKMQLEAGTVLTITETYKEGSTLWGKCEYGWLSLYYTDYDDVISGNTPEVTEGLWGTVTTQSGQSVNVRSGPSTSYGVVYGLNSGERVQIFAVKSDGTQQWGQLKDGNWICMTYVILDEVVTLESVEVQTLPIQQEYVQMQDSLNMSGATLKLTYSDGSTKTVNITANMITGFSNEKLGDVTVTVTYEEKTATFTVTIIKATVVFQNYDGTVLSSAQYAYGETVQVPDAPKKPADSEYAYEFAGWDKTVTACHGDATYTAVFRRVERPGGQWGTVATKTGDNVNVRIGPGTNYDVAYALPTGSRVEIFAQKSDGSRQWGKLADGNWICLDYVKFDTVIGDFDGNCVVNEDDAIYLLRYVIFPEKYPISNQADFSADGVIDEDDAIYLLRHVVFPDKYPLNLTGT